MTQSFNWCGSITVSQTRSIGASMSIFAVDGAHLEVRKDTNGCYLAASRSVGLPLAQRVLDRGVERVQSGRRAVAPRGRRAAAGRCRGCSISGPISSCSSPAITRRDPARDRGDGKPFERDRRPADEHVLADPLDQLAVGDDVGAADVERQPADAIAGGARASSSITSRSSIGRGAVACATPGARAPAAARPAGPGSGTSASARRSRSRRGTRPSTGVRCEQDLLDREPAREVGRRRVRRQGTSPPR